MSCAIVPVSRAKSPVSTTLLAKKSFRNLTLPQPSPVIRASAQGLNLPPIGLPELVLIDASIPYAHQLAAGTKAGITVVILDADRDGIEQITATIQAYSSLQFHAIHLVCHGTPGTLYLGNTAVHLDNLDRYTAQLQHWFSPTLLSRLADPALFLYGCNVAATDLGQQFLDRLHQLTHATIYASSTATGHASLGGNWNLERRIPAWDHATSPLRFPFESETIANYVGLLAPGDLDTTFDTDGIATLDFNGGNDAAQSIVVQSDGKILVAGYSTTGSNEDIAVARFNADGSLDTTFGTAGKVSTPVGTGNDRGYSLTLQPDGKILVAGYTTTAGNNDFTVVRYNANGTIDTTFGVNGKVVTPVGTGADESYSVIVQPDGKIVLAGLAVNGGSNDFALVRYNANGTLDTSFDADGKVFTPIGSSTDSGYSVIAQPDGKLVVAGVTFNGTNLDFAVVRYNVDGSLDTSFGTAGKVTTPIGSGDDSSYSIVQQADGKLVVAGYTNNGSNTDFALVRYNVDGSLDTSFGTAGKVTTPIGSGNNPAYSVVVQPDGKLLVVGYADNGTNTDVALTRYNSNGTIDLSFGTSGTVITSASSAADMGFGIAVQSDGKIVVAGQANGDFVVLRYAGDSPASPIIKAITTDSNVVGDGVTNDNTITLSGTAPANGTVNLFQGGAAIGTATADTAGNWSYAVSALTDGLYAFTATTTILGYTSPTSTAYNVTIDTATIAPAITAITNDSGVTGDRITNDPTLILSGTAEANSKVDVYSGASLIGTATANTSGNWSFDYTAIALGNGNHSFSVTTTDIAGNSATSAAYGVTIDTLAPSAPAITGITNDSGTPGDGITNDPTLMLVGTAEANSTVQVFQSGTLLGSTTADGAGAWTYDYTGITLAAGAYVFTAQAIDAAGNVSAVSAPRNVTIDPTAPAIPVITGITTDSGIPTDGITNDNTLIISGTAEANSSVQVFQGGTLLNTVTADGTGNWSYDYTGTALADGSYSFTAIATDAAGNSSASSAAFGVQVDRTLPTAPIVSTISTDSGSNTTDGITNDNTLILSGTAEIGSVVSIFRNGTLINTATADGSGNWSLDYTGTTLTDGAYSFTATATDKAGNVSPLSASLNVTIDTAAPAVPVVTGITTDSGTAGDGITNDNTLTISGTAEANSTVQVLLDGTAIGTATTNGTGSWSYTYATPILDGSHSLTATATDSAGNVSPTSANFNLTVDTANPAAPGISSFSSNTGSTGDTITSDTTLSLSGTAEANSRITVSRNGTVIGNTTTDGAGNWSFNDPTTLVYGVYSYTTTATDAAANTSVASAALSITVDATAPIAPVINSITTDTGTAGDRITSDATLVLNGTAEANSQVELFRGGTSIGFAPTNGSGNWTFDYTSTTLPDGVYSFTAKATDAAGNASAASTAFNVTIDTTLPTTPVITNFSTDSGTAGDKITSDNTLILTGTAEANSTVTLYRDGTLLNTTTANASGTWSFDYTGTTLPDGIYNFTATATDTAGNVSLASSAFAITVDATAPTAPTISGITTDSGISPTDGITNDTTLIISGTAEANSTVTVLRSGTTIGTTTANGTGAWSYDASATPLGNGSFVFTATAKDAAGNTSAASTPFNVTVDTSAPAAPAVTTITTDSGTAGDRITNDNTLIVGGTAAANSIVTVFRNGVSLGTAVASGTGVWSYDSSADVLTDGSYTFTATATDTAGNTSPLSAGFAVTIDTIAPPAPTITGFSTDTGTPDGITSDNTLMVTGTAEANRIVDVYLDNTLIGSTTANATGNWTYSYAPAIADGNHSFIARARDVAGNSSAASAALNVTIDTVAPTAPVITTVSTDSANPTDGITNDNTLTLSGTAEANSRVQLFLGATSIGTASADASGNWTISASTPLADGSYTFTAKATDTAGNVSAASTTFNVTVDTTAPTAPVIAAITTDTGAPADRLTSDNTLVLNGTAEANSTVQVLLNGIAIGTATTDGTGNWSYDYTGTSLADGSYTFTAKATDIAGNTGATSASFKVTIDSTAPLAPAITAITNDTNVAGDRITSDNTLIISGTAEVNSTVTVSRNGTVINTTTADATGKWSLNDTGTTLTDGTYTYTATATDAAANISSASTAFVVTVDTTAPVAPTVAAISTDSATPADAITNDNTLVVTGTAEANSTVTVFRNGTAIGTTVTNGSGTWSYDYTGTVLADGTYNFTATATDAAGNVSPASTALVVRVDTGLPAAPTIASFSSDTGAIGDGITGDNTLILTGTAEANSTVTLFDQGSLLTTVTADGAGNWTVDYTATTLPDGTHSFTVTATDAAGNVSPASTALNLVIDTAAPLAPSVTAITNDTGTPADGITNDNTLVITGTAEANSTVTLSFDGAVLGTTATDASGNWSYDYTGTSIADGTHNFTATATDAANNTSTASTPFAVQIDTIAPVAPTIAAISTDTGTPADGITSDNTLLVTGTAEANSTVTMMLDGVALGTIAADGAGNWSYDYTGTSIADGTHNFTATATDAASNTSTASTAFKVVIDTGAPAAPSITGITNDTNTPADGITNDNTLVITGTAEANSTVTVMLDGTVLNTTTADVSGNWSFDYTGTSIADGTHSFTATATDASNNTSPVSTAFNVVVDTATPNAPVVAGITDDTGTPADGITNDNTLLLNGTAEANSAVTVLMNGTAIGTTTADGTGNWNYDYSATPLADGKYVFTATATDAAGNTSVASTGLNVQVDTAAPAAPSITTIATDSATPGDGITNDNTLIINGTAEANSTVQIFLDGGWIGQIAADGTGNWSFDYSSTPLADGTYALTATATDATGTTSAVSTAFNATIDTTAPDIAVITSISTDSGTPGDGTTNDNTLIVTGTAEALSTVTLVLDGGTPLGTATADIYGNWSYDYTSTLLADGNHSFTATVTDTAGNLSADSAAFNVTIDTSSPTAPVIQAITDDTNTLNDGITADNTLILNGTAEANSTVEVLQNGVSIGTTLADGTGNWLFDYTATPLADGTYAFTAQAIDAANNISPVSAAFNVTVDATLPVAPSVTGISNDTGAIGDGLTSDNTLNIFGTAEANVGVQVYRDSVLLGSTNSDASGKWVFDYTTVPLATGTYAFTAEAIDTAGNVSPNSAPLTVTVDVTPPVAPTISGMTTDSATPGDGITNDNTLVLTGTAEVSSTIEVFQNGTSVGTTTTDTAGNWSFDYSNTPLPDGTYSFTATAIDIAGNVSPASTAFSVEIDTTPPPVPAITGMTDDSGTIGDGITNDNTILLSGTALANSAIEVLQAGSVIGTATSDATGNWAFDYTTTVLPDGVYNWSVRLSDGAGNSSTSAVLPVTIDTTSPSVSLSSAAPPEVATPFAVTATFSEAVIGFTASDLVVGNGSVSNFTAVSGSTFTFTVNPTGDGLVTVDLAAGVAQDSATNSNTAAAQLTRTLDTTPPLVPPAPTLSPGMDTGVSNQDGMTKINKPTLIGTAEAGSTIEVFAGTTSLGKTQVDAAGNWSFTPATLLQDGSYTLTVKAIDRLNNTSAASAGLKIQVDTQPVKGVVVNVAPDVRDSTIDTSVGAVTIQFSEAVAKFDLADLTLTKDGTALSLTGASLSTTDNRTWTLSNLGALTPADGKYKLIVSAKDIIDWAGNLLGADADTTWLTGHTGKALPVSRIQFGKRGIKRHGTVRNDRIIGTYYDDTLFGGAGNDYISSGYGKSKYGRDILDGGTGDDRLFAGKSRDILRGGSGNDYLASGQDDDQLFGGNDNDTLLGQDGNDLLTGGMGNDTLTGGEGRDTFIFNDVNEGSDTITDFTNVDLIDLRRIFARPEFGGTTPFARFHQFVHLKQSGADTEVRIDLDGSGTGDRFETLITLQGRPADSINAANFVVI